MVVGDFNSVTKAEEVCSNGNLDQRRCSGFVDMDTGTWLSGSWFETLSGPCFTWTRGNSITTFTGAWLDRAMGNMEWNFVFEETTITHLPKIHPDHTPLLIKPYGIIRIHPHPPPFKF